MTDQIMAVEKIRLKTQISTLSQTDMLGVEQAILVHLGLPK
jgi:mRNA interferase MazF